MTALSIQVPYPIFSDKDGSPLQNGYVWIGTQYLDPRTNPVTVYFDEALTQIAPQPLRTLNGYVYNAGSPAQLYVNGVNFSILVQNKNGSMVYSFPDGSGINPDSNGVAYTPSGAGAVATTVQTKLRESVSVKDFGAIGDGVTDDTAEIQAAIDYISTLPNGGEVKAVTGTYLVDTLSLKSKVTLNLSGAKLFFKSHATSHNPVIRIGTSTAEVSNASVIGGEIDGNATGQTFSNEEWSPGVFIWGSSDNCVKNVKIHNTKGDNITIGYDAGRVAASNRNVVEGCELYDPNVSPGRMACAITYGSENKIIYNKCSGSIDLELNSLVGECKNNLVHGNTGRIATENVNAPRTSDLYIAVVSVNTEFTRYYGNVVTNNHCAQINVQYAQATTISNNVVVGSYSTQARLIDLAGSPNCLVTGNTFIANTSIASSMTDVVRTRGCNFLSVTNNKVENASIVFHSYSSLSYGVETANIGSHYFNGNHLTGTGNYRNGSNLGATEFARIRLDQTNGGSLTATQIVGVPLKNIAGIVSRSGGNLLLSNIGGAGLTYDFSVLPHCNATAAAATAMTHINNYTYTVSGSSRIITMYTAVPGAAVTSFSFASAGNTGTFFIDIWY